MVVLFCRSGTVSAQLKGVEDFFAVDKDKDVPVGTDSQLDTSRFFDIDLIYRNGDPSVFGAGVTEQAIEILRGIK